MNMLILNAGQQTELAALNASGEPTLQLCAIPLVSGDAALTAALLTDCGAGQTWEHYGSFLQTLPVSNVSPESFQESKRQPKRLLTLDGTGTAGVVLDML